MSQGKVNGSTACCHCCTHKHTDKPFTPLTGRILYILHLINSKCFWLEFWTSFQNIWSISAPLCSFINSLLNTQFPVLHSGYSTVITKQTEKDDRREPFIASWQVLTCSHERIRRVDRSTCVSFDPSRRRRHSPAALVVEEQDEVEFLFGFVLHLLSNAEHVHGGHGDGHPVVLAAHSRHVGVDDLHTAGEGGGSWHS